MLAQYRAGVLAGAAQPEKVLEDWVAANPEDVEARRGARRGSSSGAVTADGAIKLYEQVLAKAPGNAVLLNNLAVLYQAKGNPKAVETAEKAYNAAPKAPAIQDTYGWILFESGKTDKAVESAAARPSRACRTTPRSSTTTRRRSPRRATRPRRWRC